MDLGDRIKLQREKRRMTQAELADRAHITQALVSRLENKVIGSTNSEALKYLAQALDCSADWLIGLYDERQAPETPRRRTRRRKAVPVG
jgi:transcriptional regulator with XRE-family HTH domain